jgi:hypothetical protein
MCKYNLQAYVQKLYKACLNIQSDVLYNIYIIYISHNSLSHFKMKQIIIKKFYEVISIINKKSNYLSS